MTDFSFDGLGREVGASIKGVASTPVGGTSNKLLGSAANVAGGLATGIIDSGTQSLAKVVGGSANLNALTHAASSITGPVTDVLTGKTSLSDLGNSVTGSLAGAYDSVASAASTVTGTVSDLFSGKTSLSDVGSSIMGKAETLVDGQPSSIIASITGDDASGLLGLSTILSTDLGSDWGGLNEVLLARIFAVLPDGTPDLDQLTGVYGAATESAFSAQQNWTSPFENTGPETKAPALAGMLQSGSLVPVLNALQAISPFKDGLIADTLQSGSDKLKGVVKDLEGRTGITKLNSRQVFSGMPPVKINFTLQFRALSDPQSEVMAPLSQLLQWIFPQELAAEGILSEVISKTNDVDSFIKALFPSRAPQLLGLTYGGQTYSPMVIENVDFPMDSPRDYKGRYTNLAVTISMSTLTALDRADIKKWFAQ